MTYSVFMFSISFLIIRHFFISFINIHFGVYWKPRSELNGGFMIYVWFHVSIFCITPLKRFIYKKSLYRVYGSYCEINQLRFIHLVGFVSKPQNYHYSSCDWEKLHCRCMKEADPQKWIKCRVPFTVMMAWCFIIDPGVLSKYNMDVQGCLCTPVQGDYLLKVIWDHSVPLIIPESIQHLHLFLLHPSLHFKDKGSICRLALNLPSG